MDHAANVFGPVDVLVNNAGGPTDPRPFKDLGWPDVQRHLDAHLRSAFLCISALRPAQIRLQSSRARKSAVK